MSESNRGAILLIGAGRMGGALLKGWIAAGFTDIRVVEPRLRPRCAELAARHDIALSADVAHADPDELAVAVLAIKPQVLKTQISMLQHLGATEAIVVSIAAGVTCGFLRSALGPSCDVVRAMPNLPGADRPGRHRPAHGAAHGARADRAFAESLMTPLGETFWVDDEGLIDAVTATSGSGPAYVFYLIECLAAAGRGAGVRAGRGGTASRAPPITRRGRASGRRSAAARRTAQDVTSPGGTTEAALKVLAAEMGSNP